MCGGVRVGFNSLEPAGRARRLILAARPAGRAVCPGILAVRLDIRIYRGIRKVEPSSPRPSSPGPPPTLPGRRGRKTKPFSSPGTGGRERGRGGVRRLSAGREGQGRGPGPDRRLGGSGGGSQALMKKFRCEVGTVLPGQSMVVDGETFEQ